MKKILFLVFILTSLLQASSFNTGMKYFIKGQHSKALPHFTNASNKGNKQAQFYLANMYEKGLGVKKDKKMAKKLYKLYTSKSKKKTSLKVIKKAKKVILKKKKRKLISKKKAVAKKRNRTDSKSFSKRLKKFYNPDLQAAQEITFD